MMAIGRERNRKEHVLVPPSDFPLGHLLTVSNRKPASEGEMCLAESQLGGLGLRGNCLINGMVVFLFLVLLEVLELGIIKFHMSYHGVDFSLND